MYGDGQIASTTRQGELFYLSSPTSRLSRSGLRPAAQYDASLEILQRFNTNGQKGGGSQSVKLGYAKPFQLGWMPTWGGLQERIVGEEVMCGGENDSMAKDK